MISENTEIFYDRNKLYSEVWEYTLIKLCMQYEVTHSELVKVCEILKVPRPRSGYWTQKDLGKAPPPSALPQFANPPRLLIHPPKPEKKPKSQAVEKTVSKKPEEKPKSDKEQTKIEQVVLLDKEESENETIQKTTENTKTPLFNWQDIVPREGVELPQVFEEAVRMIEKETLPEMAITIPQRTKEENTFVKNTRLVLEKNKNPKNYSPMDRYSRIRCYGKDIFDVDVGGNSVQRVLLILQALCDAFEKRGFDFVSEWNENSRNGHIYVVIMGEKNAFSIKESSKKVELEKKEKQTYLDYEYIPTGKLTLQNIYPPYDTGGKYRWSDTKYSPLEDKLNDFIAGCIFASAWKKEKEAQRKKREEERKQQETLKEEKERLARIEKQRVANFNKAADYWEHYQSMKGFFAIVRQSYRKSAQKNNDTAKWIQWAREYLTQYKAKCEELVRYDVGEYKEETRSFVQTYNPPPEEPYNYWKKPWYLKR